MDMRIVGFSLTDKCNASCSVCCFQCSPHGSFLIDEGMAKRYIDEAGETGTVGTLYFSGGEPLLFPEVLKRLTRYAFESFGIRSLVATNGFWGADIERGTALMRELAECGLSRVRISADLYHQQYISADAVKGALRIAHGLGILSHVTVMDVKGHPNMRAVIESLRPEIYLAPFIAWYPLYLPEAVLSNRQLGIGRDDLLEPVPWDACYCRDFSGPRLFWDGGIYNCCSQFTREIPRMRVGTVGETTLAQAWRRMYSDPILDVIRRAGVTWLAEKARELGEPIRQRYTSECELCRDLLCDKELVSKLEPLARGESQKRRVAWLLRK